MAQGQLGVELHQRIAQAIRTTRKTKGMSAQDLADQTARLGYPISRQQIANYESGRKHGLDVADLLVLAEALTTAPVCLVFPGPYQENVRICPESQELPQLWWAQWFSGLLSAISDVPFTDGERSIAITSGPLTDDGRIAIQDVPRNDEGKPMIDIEDAATWDLGGLDTWGRHLGPLRRAREALELEERKSALRRSQEGHRDPKTASQLVDALADLQRRYNDKKVEIARDAEAQRRAAENDEEKPR
jgi:transcriptional regulator with XRE-family HTH domain